MFAARMIFYAVRLALYYALAVLRFLGQRGSRAIVPALLIVGALLARPRLHEVITVQLRTADPGLEPETLVLDVLLVVLLGVLILAYVLASRVLGFTLGAFPAPLRPLPPMRALQAHETEVSSAVVRVVVPPLPRRKATAPPQKAAVE